jgi:hypothetical protein
MSKISRSAVRSVPMSRVASQAKTSVPMVNRPVACAMNSLRYPHLVWRTRADGRQHVEQVADERIGRAAGDVGARLQEEAGDADGGNGERHDGDQHVERDGAGHEEDLVLIRLVVDAADEIGRRVRTAGPPRAGIGAAGRRRGPPRGGRRDVPAPVAPALIGSAGPRLTPQTSNLAAVGAAGLRARRAIRAGAGASTPPRTPARTSRTRTPSRRASRAPRAAGLERVTRRLDAALHLAAHAADRLVDGIADAADGVLGAVPQAQRAGADLVARLPAGARREQQRGARADQRAPEECVALPERRSMMMYGISS